jgi:hypothetical protein
LVKIQTDSSTPRDPFRAAFFHARSLLIHEDAIDVDLEDYH